MRSSRGRNRNTNGSENRSRQFRGRVGQQLIRKNKFKANAQRQSFNGVSPLNRRNDNATVVVDSRQKQVRQNKFFPKQGIKFSESRRSNSGLQMRGQKGQLHNPRGGASARSVARGYAGAQQGNSGSVVRGRLRGNFGFMRSDTIAQRQQIKHELEQARVQRFQQQQEQQRQQNLQSKQQWLQRSWKKLQPGAPKEPQRSARTAVYEPSASFTIQIRNTAQQSSDVAVVFGKAKNRQNAINRSVLLQLSEGADVQTPVPTKGKKYSNVSFEDDINVEIYDEHPVNESLETSGIGDGLTDLDVLVV